MPDSSEYDLMIAADIKTVLGCDEGVEVELAGTVHETRQEPTTINGNCRTVGVLHVLIDGGGVLVTVDNPDIPYAGGSLEFIVGKPVEPGDHIRVRATVIDNQYALLDAGDHAIYLSAPSPGRYDTHEQQRHRVNEQLFDLSDEIRTGDFVKAREIFADLRTQELTDSERAELHEHVDRIPENDQPVHLPTTEHARLVNDAYGCNPETMTKELFFMFADGVFDGLITPNETVGHNYSAVVQFAHSPKLSADEMCMLVEKYNECKQRNGSSTPV